MGVAFVWAGTLPIMLRAFSTQVSQYPAHTRPALLQTNRLSVCRLYWKLLQCCVRAFQSMQLGSGVVYHFLYIASAVSLHPL
jgi:hypothetical protein